jgi:hypothetical protein
MLFKTFSAAVFGIDAYRTRSLPCGCRRARDWQLSRSVPKGCRWERYDAMLDEVTTEVSVPSGEVQNHTETILGKIVISLERQADDYRTALVALQHGSDDPRTLNEVLRIA